MGQTSLTLPTQDNNPLPTTTQLQNIIGSKTCSAQDNRLLAWLVCIESLACGSGAHRLMAKHHVNPKRCSPNNLFDGLVRETQSHGCAHALCIFTAGGELAGLTSPLQLAIGTQFARRKTIAA